MSHASLTLGDTAMALLRRYIQSCEDMASTMNRGETTSDLNYFFSVQEENFNLVDELILELWVLWVFSDHQPHQTFDWHFVIKDELITQLNDIFMTSLPVRIESLGRLIPGFPCRMQLVDGISRVYQETVIRRGDAAYVPLMLSDQAMILLRQYMRLEDDEYNRLTHLYKDSPRRIDDEIYESVRLGRFGREVIENLVQDIRVLWLHPELRLQCSLDWHFVFNDDLMHQCRMLFNPSSRYHADAVQSLGRLFIYQVAKAYKRAVAEREGDNAPVIDAE